MKIITANWSAAPHIRACTTTRACGNLATHVNDDPDQVEKNRFALKNFLALPTDPHWLNQTHSAVVVDLNQAENTPTADAAYSNQPNKICAILTADCLPILLCDKHGQEIAAVHAGWRGLINGVIENTLQKFRAPRETLLAWIGPHINAKHYEIGTELRNNLLEKNKEIEDTFTPHKDRWLANLSLIATRILQQNGVRAVSVSEHCTFSSENFYSYRRDGEKSGRQATLIWTKPSSRA